PSDQYSPGPETSQTTCSPLALRSVGRPLPPAALRRPRFPSFLDPLKGGGTASPSRPVRRCWSPVTKFGPQEPASEIAGQLRQIVVQPFAFDLVELAAFDHRGNKAVDVARELIAAQAHGHALHLLVEHEFGF